MSDLRRIINEALEISDEVPEEYKKDTYLIILRHLLKSREMPDGDEETNVITPKQGADQSNGWLERVVQNIPEPHDIGNNGTRAQQTVWAVITLQSRNEEAVAETIRDIIRTELGISPESRSNTGTQLQKLTPRYLIRQKRSEGQGYKYEPSAHSLEIFEGFNE